MFLGHEAFVFVTAQIISSTGVVAGPKVSLRLKFSVAPVLTITPLSGSLLIAPPAAMVSVPLFTFVTPVYVFTPAKQETRVPQIPSSSEWGG